MQKSILRLLLGENLKWNLFSWENGFNKSWIRFISNFLIFKHKPHYIVRFILKTGETKLFVNKLWKINLIQDIFTQNQFCWQILFFP